MAFSTTFQHYLNQFTQKPADTTTGQPMQPNAAPKNMFERIDQAALTKWQANEVARKQAHYNNMTNSGYTDRGINPSGQQVWGTSSQSVSADNAARGIDMPQNVRYFSNEADIGRYEARQQRQQQRMMNQQPQLSAMGNSTGYVEAPSVTEAMTSPASATPPAQPVPAMNPNMLSANSGLAPQYRRLSNMGNFNTPGMNSYNMAKSSSIYY
jgi:hypothetical protein